MINDDRTTWGVVNFLLNDDLTLSDIQKTLERGGLNVKFVGPVTAGSGILFEVRRKTNDESLNEQ